MKFRVSLVVLVFVLAASCAIYAQQVSDTPGENPTITALLSKLESKHWQERSDALDEIRTNPDALGSPVLRSALLNLQDQENKERETGYKESLNGRQDPKVAGDADDDEGYGEYYAALGEVVDSFGDWNDPRQACIMVNSGFIDYPPSDSAAAARASAAMPCLLRMVAENDEGTRAVAIPMLVEALGKGKDRLDSKTIQSANEMVSQSLFDSHANVRAAAVFALGKFGGPNVISILQKIANSDTSSEQRMDGSTSFPIREAAIEAIIAIQQRAHQQQIPSTTR
ncbi:MAG TPA: HEAT repeat domain-containing protein [Terriglobales bacterium]|nr:HEAT repeat domain-containing protein [Terriglobales bacterium]